MLKNVYLIEHLIGQKIKRHDIWHSSNIEEPEYIDYVPKEYLEMWNNDEIDWVKHRFNSMTFQKIYKRYIEIYHELKTVRPGPKRREL
ncbi:hypothetical protein KJ656_07920, partial [bacterium]|nr:hypothetical protein [bacterium]